MDRTESRSDTVKSDTQDGTDHDSETVPEIPPNVTDNPEPSSLETAPNPDDEGTLGSVDVTKESEGPENKSETVHVPSEQTESQSQLDKTTDPERISASHQRNSFQRGQTSTHTLNRLAIFTSSQNKLPTSKLKNIVDRVGRPTFSSGSKRSTWYKNEQYVDMNSYSWKNLALYVDYQKQMWTEYGTIKTTYKK